MSVIGGASSTVMPKPKSDRFNYAFWNNSALDLVLHSFAPIDCRRSLSGFNRITIHSFSASREFAIVFIRTVLPDPLTPVIMKICCTTGSVVKASRISRFCLTLSIVSFGLFPNDISKGFPCILSSHRLAAVCCITAQFLHLSGLYTTLYGFFGVILLYTFLYDFIRIQAIYTVIYGSIRLMPILYPHTQKKSTENPKMLSHWYCMISGFLSSCSKK